MVLVVFLALVAILVIVGQACLDIQVTVVFLVLVEFLDLADILVIAA